MSRKLSKTDAIAIANKYREQYRHILEGKVLLYELVSVSYIKNKYAGKPPVWEIVFDVKGWDDIWYSIIISDKEKEVICCCSMWEEEYFPHITKNN